LIHFYKRGKMFFPVLLILATIWTATDGALSCKTDKGLECVFPFKSSAGSSEYNQCKPASKGRTWCATEVKANLVYSAWGYCNLDTCKEVQTIAEEKSLPSCIACIVQFAPVCIPKCLPKPFNTACSQCVLQNGIECAGTCGFGNIQASEFGLDGVVDFQKEGDAQQAGVPACVQVSNFFRGRYIPGSVIKKNSAAMCGTHCADNFGTAAAAWNWFNSNIKNGRNALTCFCLETKGEAIPRAFIDCGLGPANNQAECPPKLANGKN